MRALGFGIGVVVGQLLACGALVLLGTTLPRLTSPHPTFQGVLQMALGSTLLGLAVVIKRRPQTTKRASSDRSEALLERLRHIQLETAVVGGLLLGIGGPKRLVLTALASASISAAGVASSQKAALVLWYGLLATALVWLPVVAFLILGGVALAWLHTGVTWLGRHQRVVTLYTLVVVGAALVVSGIATV